MFDKVIMFLLTSFLYLFILFDKLQDYDEVYLQVNFESHCCCK